VPFSVALPMGIEHHHVVRVLQDLHTTDHATTIHAVRPVRFSHRSPFVNERTQQCPHTFVTHRGGEKNTMFSVAGLCGPTSGEIMREAARGKACVYTRCD
jgi:hypothetical protein